MNKKSERKTRMTSGTCVFFFRSVFLGIFDLYKRLYVKVYQYENSFERTIFLKSRKVVEYWNSRIDFAMRSSFKDSNCIQFFHCLVNMLKSIQRLNVRLNRYLHILERSDSSYRSLFLMLMFLSLSLCPKEKFYITNNTTIYSWCLSIESVVCSVVYCVTMNDSSIHYPFHG